VRLHYVEQGSPSGLPVVLVHGFPDSWRSYERVLPSLPSSLRVFAVSLRGHGDSGRPDTGYTPKDFADDLAAFMDARDLPSAVIVGHSMGASAAQRFAVDHPSRTRALVLIGAAPSWRGNANFEELTRAVAALGDRVDPVFARGFQVSTIAQSVPQSFVDTVVDESLKAPVRVWKEAIAGLARADTAVDLRAITAPTLVLWGARDALARRVDQQALDAGISRSQLIVYEAAGHALHWEEPHRFALDLLAFLERNGIV
jgi:pimeloyl-ACP methyl ester carboxylesterase